MVGDCASIQMMVRSSPNSVDFYIRLAMEINRHIDQSNRNIFTHFIHCNKKSRKSALGSTMQLNCVVALHVLQLCELHNENTISTHTILLILIRI